MFCRKSPLSTQLCRRLLRICVDRIYIFCQHKSCQFRKSSSTKRYSVNTNTPKSPLKRNQISRRRIVRISRVKEHHILRKEPNILSKTNFKKSLLKRNNFFEGKWSELLFSQYKFSKIILSLNWLEWITIDRTCENFYYFDGELSESIAVRILKNHLAAPLTRIIHYRADFWAFPIAY